MFGNMSTQQVLLYGVLLAAFALACVALYYSILAYQQKSAAAAQLRAMGGGYLPETLLGDSMFGILGSVLFMIMLAFMAYLVYFLQHPRLLLNQFHPSKLL